MAQGRYWGGQLVIHPHEALMQQGLSFTASHRKAALADNAVQQYMFDVCSVMHASIEVTVKGDCWLDFGSVSSYQVGAGTSLSVFNRNTEFTNVNTFCNKLYHTTSIEAGSLGIFEGILPGGEKASGSGGKLRTDELHLHPGIYQLQITNKAGAATDVAVNITWEEVHGE